MNTNQEAVLNHIEKNLTDGYFEIGKLHNAVIHTTSDLTCVLTEDEIRSAVSSLVQGKILNYTGVNQEFFHIISSRIPQS